MDDLGLDLSDAFRSLRLVIRGQPFPNAELDWDRDALDATVEADTGAFRGSFAAHVWAHELSNLRSLLQALFDQLGQDVVASFRFRDVAIEANFQLHRRRAFVVEVALRPNPAECERLTFELSLNPSQITNWIVGLDRIASRFPPAITTKLHAGKGHLTRRVSSQLTSATLRVIHLGISLPHAPTLARTAAG